MIPERKVANRVGCAGEVYTHLLYRRKVEGWLKDCDDFTTCCVYAGLAHWVLSASVAPSAPSPRPAPTARPPDSVWWGGCPHSHPPRGWAPANLSSQSSARRCSSRLRRGRTKQGLPSQCDGEAWTQAQEPPWRQGTVAGVSGRTHVVRVFRPQAFIFSSRSLQYSRGTRK